MRESPGGTQVPLLSDHRSDPHHWYQRQMWARTNTIGVKYHTGYSTAEDNEEICMNDLMNYEQAMGLLIEQEQADVTHVINAATHLWIAYNWRLKIQWYRRMVMRHKQEGDDDVMADIESWLDNLKLATIPKFLVEINETVYTGDSPMRNANRSTKLGVCDDAINAIFGTRYYAECRKAAESFKTFAKQDHIFIAGFIAGVVDTSEQRRALRNGTIYLPPAVSKDGRRLAAALLIGSQL